MEDYERQVIAMKREIRRAINSSGLPLTLIEYALDGIRNEVIGVQLETAREALIDSAEAVNAEAENDTHTEGEEIENGIHENNVG